MAPTLPPDQHFRSLERMYLGAPTNQGYRNLTITIADGAARIGVDVTPDLHHAAGALHGAHLFKLLDDAAFFAANSVVTDVFVLTAQFSVQMLAQATEGTMHADGALLRAGSSLLFAESVVRSGERELARGHGTFARSRQVLTQVPGYGAR